MNKRIKLKLYSIGILFLLISITLISVLAQGNQLEEFGGTGYYESSIKHIKTKQDDLSTKQSQLNKLHLQSNKSKYEKHTSNKDAEKIYESDLMLYATEKVDLYEESRSDSKVISTLDKGTEIHIVGLTSTGYCKCEVDNLEGYILSEYLKDKEIEITATGNTGDYQRYAWSFFDSYGWDAEDFNCLVKLWNRESGWNPSAKNPSSGAYGIPQSLPASKMASEGDDYLTNYQTQIRWGLKYISQRYGSPTGAWSHSEATGWY